MTKKRDSHSHSVKQRNILEEEKSGRNPRKNQFIDGAQDLSDASSDDEDRIEEAKFQH